MELVLVLIMSALAALVLYRVVSAPMLLDAMEDPTRPMEPEELRGSERAGVVHRRTPRG